MVLIPENSHTQIQQVLETNQRLLKILADIQNNGYQGSQEQQIYQQRLFANLLYLSTLADPLFHNRNGSSTLNNQETITERIPRTKQQIIESLVQPIHVRSKLDPSVKPTEVIPVPPLLKSVEELGALGLEAVQDSSYTTEAMYIREDWRLRPIKEEKNESVADVESRKEPTKEDSDSDTEYHPQSEEELDPMEEEGEEEELIE